MGNVDLVLIVTVCIFSGRRSELAVDTRASFSALLILMSGFLVHISSLIYLFFSCGFELRIE